MRTTPRDRVQSTAEAGASPRGSTDAPVAPGRLEVFLVMLCVSVPSFMINLDSNIVAVSLPSIANSLGADFAGIEWVISAYTLTFATLVLPAGSLADRYGRKRTLIAGLALFTAASLACGAAPSVAALNIARAFQGVGAALQLSAALATLSHTFHGAARARAFAFWGSVIGIAISLGPIAGGLITQTLGWEWAFYVNVPIGLIMIILTQVSVKESRDPSATRVDIPGVVTFAAFLSLTTLALITGNERGWTSLPILLEAPAAAIALAAFITVELRHERPMLDLGLLRHPTFLGANAAAVGFAAGFLTMLTYIPIYIQKGLGYGPQAAGLLMLPVALPLFVVPRLVAVHLTHRFSGRALVTVGCLLVSAGLFWLAFEAKAFDYGAMLGGMLLAGVGAGFLNGETAKVGMTAIPPERAGMASGISGTVRFSGIVIGFAALGAILYGTVAVSVTTGLPDTPEGAPRTELVRDIAAGNRLDASLGEISPAAPDTARQSFGAGYEAIFLAAGGFVALTALLAWSLIRSSDTAPVPRAARARLAAAPALD